MKKPIVFAFVAVATIVVIIGVIILIVATKPFARGQTYRAAKNYYARLCRGDYEKAFEYVDYYDTYGDVEPQLPYTNAQQIWVNRVSQLRTSGAYLMAAERIQIELDDGYPVGRADIAIIIDGVETHATHIIYFDNLRGKWRVQGVRSYDKWDDERITAIDQAISGFVPLVAKEHYLPCDKLPTESEIKQAMETHRDVIREIKEVSPESIEVDIDTKTCPGHADLVIWYASHYDLLAIQAILENASLDVPFRLRKR